jgi:hypothetical protein
MASNFTYDPVSRRYRSVETGRYIPAKEVRAVVDKVIDNYQSEFVVLATKLQTGELSLAEWQLQMASLIRQIHTTTGVASLGGFDMVSKSDYGYIEGLIKVQIGYLNQFAQDIADATQLVNGSLLQRTKLYAQAARGSFESIQRRAAKFANLTEEKRNLGSADHCTSCVEYASRGWVPIGTLPMIGQDSPCKVNCRCTFTFK